MCIRDSLCSAQDFEGEIVFSAYHKYADSSIKSTPNLPSNVVYKISGEHVRIEQQTQMGKQVILFDTLSLMKTIVINQNGQELAIQLKMEVDSNLKIKTTQLEDSLKIFGFTAIKCYGTAMMRKHHLTHMQTYITPMRLPVDTWRTLKN